MKLLSFIWIFTITCSTFYPGTEEIKHLLTMGSCDHHTVYDEDSSATGHYRLSCTDSDHAEGKPCDHLCLCACCGHYYFLSDLLDSALLNRDLVFEGFHFNTHYRFLGCAEIWQPPNA